MQICEMCMSRLMQTVLISQVLRDLFMEYSRLNPMTIHKRIKLCGVLTCLFTVSISAAISIVNLSKADGSNVSRASRNIHNLKFSLLLYSLCVLGILLVVVIGVWAAMEVKYSRRRRRLQTHAIRLLLESSVMDNTIIARDDPLMAMNMI